MVEVVSNCWWIAIGGIRGFGRRYLDGIEDCWANNVAYWIQSVF